MGWFAEIKATTHPEDVSCLVKSKHTFLFPRALEIPKKSTGGSTISIDVSSKMARGEFGFPTFDVNFDLSYEKGDVRVAGVAPSVRVPCVAGDVSADGNRSSLAVTNLGTAVQVDMMLTLG